MGHRGTRKIRILDRCILSICVSKKFEIFSHLLKILTHRSVAAAIVFDLTRPETFRSVEKVSFNKNDIEKA